MNARSSCFAIASPRRIRQGSPVVRRPTHQTAKREAEVSSLLSCNSLATSLATQKGTRGRSMPERQFSEQAVFKSCMYRGFISITIWIQSCVSSCPAHSDWFQIRSARGSNFGAKRLARSCQRRSHMKMLACLQFHLQASYLGKKQLGNLCSL